MVIIINSLLGYQCVCSSGYRGNNCEYQANVEMKAVDLPVEGAIGILVWCAFMISK